MKSPRILVFILLLQLLILLGQWTGPSGHTVFENTASAQIPDAGAQNLQIINELKASNAKLDKLIDLLQSGNLQVKVVTPDEKKVESAK